MAKNNCDNCFYYRKMDSGQQRFCAYLFLTDQRRPCPPGDECTVKIGRTVYRRKGKTDA